MMIHFIGIGGIGVSALAKYYLSQGFLVSGSDVSASEITDDLGKMGAKIYVGHEAKNVPIGADLIVYSVAVQPDNLEFVEAQRRRIKCQTYAQALGELTKKMWTIAVSGTHGKSTTTAMIAIILIEAGLDPTVIIGTKLREFGPPRLGEAGPPSLGEAGPPSLGEAGNSNYRFGKGKHLLIEADEYSASFLNYWPKLIVLTNIEDDHLDYYKNLKNILKAFKEYVGHLKSDGALVINQDDRNILSIIKNSKRKIKNYNSRLKIEGLNLKIPGQHNLMNAYAAISAARILNIPDNISIKALNNFRGTWRRFEYKGEINGAKIFDDYGHHPTEIKATLQGAREYLMSHCEERTCVAGERRGNPDKRQATSVSRGIASSPLAIRNDMSGRLWCVFQPHQYQRTYQLFNHFVGAFDQADKVIILPIYSVEGREKESIKKKVSSEKLVEAIKNEECIYLRSFDEAEKYLRQNLRRGDLAVIMGAGDVNKLTKKLISPIAQ